MLNPTLNVVTILASMAVIIAFIFFVGKIKNELYKFVIYFSLVAVAFAAILNLMAYAIGDAPSILSRNGTAIFALSITSFLWLIAYQILKKAKSIYDNKKSKKEEFDYTEWSFLKVSQQIAFFMFLMGSIIILALTYTELFRK